VWTDLGERVPPIFLQKNILDHVESPTGWGWFQLSHVRSWSEIFFFLTGGGNVWENDCIIGKDCARRNFGIDGLSCCYNMFYPCIKRFLILIFSSGLESLSPSSDGEHQPQQQAQSHRGVKPVYLRCSQGSVSWLYPRGALRVVLRYGTAGKEFQVRKTTTKISPSRLTFLYTHTHNF
jgi:hypothetical protein